MLSSAARCSIRFDEISLHQVCFAEVLMGAAVPRIVCQGPLIMSDGQIEMPQTAISVAEIVLNFGITVIAQPR
jgi:hypothetical protein